MGAFNRMVAIRIAACGAGLLAPGAGAMATPFDKCGTFVNGLEGCIMFQPDDMSQQVRPDQTAPPVGTHSRVRGDLQSCASVCFVPCITQSVITACVGTPCRADFDGNGTLNVADIFAFLGAWFAGNISADFDQSGSLAVADIFAFINAWFAGCP